MIWFRCKNCPIVEDFLDSLRALGVFCHCRWDTIKCTRRVFKLWQFALFIASVNTHAVQSVNGSGVKATRLVILHHYSFLKVHWFFLVCVCVCAHAHKHIYKSMWIYRIYRNNAELVLSSIMSIPGIELRSSGLEAVSLPSESSQFTFLWYRYVI